MIAPDSSVVIAALAPWHVGHDAARAALAGRDAALIGHVAIETVSALSRMPEGHRIAPTVVLEALERAFRKPWLHLGGGAVRDALAEAVAGGIRGGALYDALIAATAAGNGAALVSADRRARRTYDVLGVDVRFIELPQT